MTIIRNEGNDDFRPKLFLISDPGFIPEHFHNVIRIMMPGGVDYPEIFYLKPDLREIGPGLGDLDAFVHWYGHFLFLEFKHSLSFSSKAAETQIRSQLCLALETNATYWIIKWSLTPENGFEVSELLEKTPDGKVNSIKIDVEGLKEMYKTWCDDSKQNPNTNSKWNQTKPIFDRLKNRIFHAELDKRHKQDDDDTTDGIAAIQ